ncbi:hypothetical protein F8M41_020779 [Gigaspora margarita]|uniref:DUF7932 domain-containing protein n=1 Tax=Gigaspora margarita TaxID=4874 RepID=A0A8H4AHU9_GIGMA|nr:hypothetical protein F8M41_020779 [Gigaspora margarita]
METWKPRKRCYKSDEGRKCWRDSIAGASIEFSGKYREHEPGYAVKNYQNTLSCTNVNVFVLKARGGDGGHGGIGGDGANGAMGTPGLNATRYTCGTNGGKGGNGGNAGAGTSGADGGKGGQITLSMNDTDAGLLLMFVTAWTPRISYSLNVSGGKGGNAGNHGTPGYGGPGGFGGSSYSWSETYYNSNGQSSTYYYTNPGGFPGPPGIDGLRPTVPLYNGTSGTNGIFRFMIKDSVTNIVKEYNEIFDIRLHRVIAHSITGVYEPEAKIIIDSLTVRNKSNMPTPRRNIRINIVDKTWIRNQKQKEHIMLPLLIDKLSSKEVNCNQPFSFLLKGHVVNKPGPPLRATDSLFFTATMTGLERLLPVFDITGHCINIQFPIELTRISHMNSMVVGHVTKVIWNVINTSNVDFGVLSENKRLIRVRLCKTGGEVSSSALKFGLNPDQKGVSMIPPVQTMENEYIFDIPLLEAGKTLQLEATLALTEAETFECAEFWLYLELGKITEPFSPKIVHIQSFDVRVSTIYRGFPQNFYPDVLLVTNHKTTREEYLAWVKLFKEILGLQFFIWDISQMGHFGLKRNIKTLYSAEPTTLMKDLAGKTMIILDNEFEYGDNCRKVTARNFILKHEWMEAIHKNDNKFYVFNSSAEKFQCVNILDQLLTNAFEESRSYKSEFESVRSFTHSLMGKEKDSSEEVPIDTITENNEKISTEKNISEMISKNVHSFTQFLMRKKKFSSEEVPIDAITDNNEETFTEKNLPEIILEEKVFEENISEENPPEQLTNDPAKLVDEITEIHIKPKVFFNMEKRMFKKATKVDKNLRRLRPHFQHHVIYQWNNVKVRLFQSKKTREKKGGCVIIAPSMTTTKRRIIFSAAAWHKTPASFIATEINLRGVIAGLGIDNHFRILEMIFITGPLNEENENNDISLFLNGGHRILDDREKQVAEILKQQITYDIAVELSTICDGIGGNSSLMDEEILVMMENLRRLVWKVESLSGKNCLSPETADKNLLPTISEENDNLSASLNYESEPDQTQLNQNINYSDDVDQGFNGSNADSNINSNCNDVIENTTYNAPNITAVGDIGEENEIIFYMFPVNQDTPLGEWMMDILAQLYAFIKCLRSGIHQSILPNRRTAKMQQQSMDLLHRIGDATIIDFSDPRSSDKLEYLNAKIENCALIDNDGLFDLPASSLKTEVTLDSIGDIVNSHNNIPDNHAIATSISIQYDESTSIPAPMSIASGLSFASAMTRATKISSSSFSYSGPSASRSRIPYKKLDPTRRKIIKSFKMGAKLQLRDMIKMYYKHWKKDSGILDLSRKDLRRKAMETIFKPFELLVDNTLYGRNLQKKGDGLVGGVKNIIISHPIYIKQKEAEIKRIVDMEDMIQRFLIFQEEMILDILL